LLNQIIIAIKKEKKQVCKDQRNECAKQVECGDGEPDFMKREIKAIQELVKDAPEPEL